LKILIAVMIVLSSISIFAFENSGSDDFIFNNKRGVVTFNHSFHQENYDCQVCHPAFPEEYNDNISIKAAAHKTCKNCHKADGGPVSCKECHIK
jgi:hypothetical protein